MVLVADECRVERESGTMSIWYPKGKQPTIRVEQEREAVSFYGALEVATGKETVIKAPYQKSEYTVQFLRKLEQRYAGKKVLLLWDGAPWHRGKVREYLQEKNKRWFLEILYFPPYSPDMNPQEQVWKVAKRRCTHNSEVAFDVKVRTFYQFLRLKKFNTNFLKKFIPSF